jgi:hypothetical protein
MSLIEWINAEGLKVLILACIGMGGTLARSLLQRMDQLAQKVDQLHDDMIRVKTRLGVKPHEAD